MSWTIPGPVIRNDRATGAGNEALVHLRKAAMRDRLSILTEDQTLAKRLSRPLKEAGFEVQILSAAPKFWHRAQRFMSNLLIVDLDTMGSQPTAQCRRLRMLINAQILAVRQDHDEEGLLEAFAAGVDDCMSGPISSDELVARVEALLRRKPTAGPGRHACTRLCPDIILDRDKRVLYVRGQRLRLTPIEYSLLECLIRHAGQVVSRDTLLQEVWGGDKVPGVGSLNLYVYYLRRKLERDPRRPEHIRTKWGVGYYLATE